MNVRYRVELGQAERDELQGLLSGGNHAARKLKRAQILLASDAGGSDGTIATTLGIGGSTVYRTKRRFVLGPWSGRGAKSHVPGQTANSQARKRLSWFATASSSPPRGRARWTLDLLAGELVRLTEHDSLSRETVRRRLAEKRP
jgi:hypothetical protein